eukprot:Pgem_evm1s17254
MTTYYEDTVEEFRPFRNALVKSEDTDVCVIGGGVAGLCVALSLGEGGKEVVVLEKNRI